ncbi:hypothetical protein TWF569_006490 [Orbilia oligospora]|nr:hypothetical protein TWF103_011351 [Orbilia oligospora]KAF3145941.1 hypothetical protein TWF569_006490 [Orbilia oligospora]
MDVRASVGCLGLNLFVLGSLLHVNNDGFYNFEYFPGTPLRVAAWYGNKAAVELLLDHGADIGYSGGFIALDPGLKPERSRNVFVCDGTALEPARQWGHTGIVDILERNLSGRGSQGEVNTPRELNAPREDDTGLGWDLSFNNPSPSSSVVNVRLAPNLNL